jgi:divalent metal cation (Fe/Co/Zn/Cd) transporter
MIVGSRYLENASWLDPVGGLVISLMVIQAGWGNTKGALFELADVTVDEDVSNKVEKYANQALDTVNAGANDKAKLRQVQGIKSGQNYLMDIEIAVPKKWTVDQTRGVEDLVRERLGLKVRGVKRVRVRFVANDVPSDYMDEFIGPDVSPQSSPEPESEEHHHHSHSRNGDTRKRK